MQTTKSNQQEPKKPKPVLFTLAQLKELWNRYWNQDEPLNQWAIE